MDRNPEIELGAMDGVTWLFESDTTRAFVAFAQTAFPKPAFAGLVAPSNLHAVERADLVIVTRRCSCRLRTGWLPCTPMTAEVLVTTQRTVFDEFSVQH